MCRLKKGKYRCHACWFLGRVSFLTIFALRQLGVVLKRRLKMFGEKKLGKCTMYIGTQTFLFCFFIFTSFNITALMLLVKVTLIQNCKSMTVVKFRWTNALCRPAGVNVLVQNTFRSTICLLSLHLLALKVTDGNTRWMCEICWKLTLKTSDCCHWRRSGV